jgi:hypothetical protein
MNAALTEAQREALKWFFEHNGDGAFAGRGHTLVAGGEVGPHTRRTWNSLAAAGLIEPYGKKRVRLTDKGRDFAKRVGA